MLLYGLSPDLLLRDFVRQFAGLTGSAKAKAVLIALPNCKRLADVRDDAAMVSVLLQAMQAEALPIRPQRFGFIGGDALRARFAEWYGVERFWYAKTDGVSGDGAPFVAEVAVAETMKPGPVVYGLNFSPAFGDPFAGTWLPGGKISSVQGVAGFLSAAHIITPDRSGPEQEAQPATAAVVHVISPRLTTLDRGKSRVAADVRLQWALGDLLWKAGKTLYEEGERRNKDAVRQAQRDERRRAGAAKSERLQQWTFVDACFAVIPAAFAKASGDGALPVSAHTLFYSVRPMVQAYTDDILRPKYFEQTILPQYQRERGALKGLYYEPRGTLYEPHTGKVVPLGTREVEDYAFPAWTYDKILFIEKQGLAPTLHAARLGDRYDMAIVAGEGFASVAARSLLSQADKDREYRLFVLHDADPAGYSIARTLGEETDRMPEHSVKIVDLGLRFEEGLAMGLETEAFTRKKAVDKRIAARLTERERQAFVGTLVGLDSQKQRMYACERIELNAMRAQQFVAFIEDGLAHHEATEKIVPPESVVRAEAFSRALASLSALAREEVERRFDIGALVEQFLETDAVQQLAREAAADATQQGIRDHIAQWRDLQWSAALSQFISPSIEDARSDLVAAIETMLRSSG